MLKTIERANSTVTTGWIIVESKMCPERGAGMEQRMHNSSFEVISLRAESATAESYNNHSIADVNDHEVRISIMTEAYHWHCHPDSDEVFLALEGGLFIEFDDHTVELLPGHLITVPRGVRHRTRPIGNRSVNLTFERAGARSETLTSPQEESVKPKAP
jgi:mannose-6-phosphate isomerase-like protein (cupin superfamily)